jgi:hypothetical protein
VSMIQMPGWRRLHGVFDMQTSGRLLASALVLPRFQVFGSDVLRNISDRTVSHFGNSLELTCPGWPDPVLELGECRLTSLRTRWD